MNSPKQIETEEGEFEGLRLNVRPGREAEALNYKLIASCRSMLSEQASMLIANQSRPSPVLWPVGSVAPLGEHSKVVERENV